MTVHNGGLYVVNPLALELRLRHSAVHLRVELAVPVAGGRVEGVVLLRRVQRQRAALLEADCVEARYLCW